MSADFGPNPFLEDDLDPDDAFVVIESDGGTIAGYDYRPKPSEMLLPRVRLAQALTPEVMEGVARGGQWLLPGAPPQDKVTMSLLGVKNTRRYEIKESEDSRVTMCQSPDGETGYGSPGGACELCPFSQFTTKDNGDRVAPSCNRTWHYLVQLEGGSAAEMTLSERSQAAPARQINAYYSQANFVPGRLTMVLGSDLKTTKQRKFYVAKVELADPYGRGLQPGQQLLPGIPAKAGQPATRGGGKQEATPRQHKYVKAILREVGMSDEDLNALSHEMFSEDVETLSRRDLSALIDAVQNGRRTLEVAST